MNTKNSKRPRLVWIVFLYYLIADVLGAGALLILWHSASLSEQARTAIETITTTDWALIWLNMALELAGAIALFRLRRMAFPLFVGALCTQIAQTSIHYREGIFSGANNHSTHIVAFSLATHLFVCAYAWRLRSRSVLI